MCCETTLSESEMLAELAKQYDGNEVEALAAVIRSRGGNPGDAFYWYHLFVLGGRNSIVGLPEFYEKSKVARR